MYIYLCSYVKICKYIHIHTYILQSNLLPTFGPASKEKQYFCPFGGNEEDLSKNTKITPNVGTLLGGHFYYKTVPKWELFLAKMLAADQSHAIYLYLYLYLSIYIYAVKLKSGPIFALFKVKSGPICFVCFAFLFSRISFSLQKEEEFWKTNPKKTTKKHNFQS